MCYVELKIAPTDAIRLFLLYTEDLPAALWLPTPHAPSIPIDESAWDIGIASKDYLKWQTVQLAIHSTAGV